MERIDNIILLGTSHVAKESAKEIEEVISEYNPELVCIELDYLRFKSLMSKKKEKPSMIEMVKQFGVSGAMFTLIAGYVQKKVGDSLNIEAGVDMKTAYLTARENKIPTALIDQNIKITMKNLSKLSFIRKIRMFSSLFLKSFKKEYREKFSFDVKKGVPDSSVIRKLLKVVKEEVPDLYQILIEDRNIFMANKLLNLKQSHQGIIVAVVGAGHLDGMLEILKNSLNQEILEGDYNYKFTVDL